MWGLLYNPMLGGFRVLCMGDMRRWLVGRMYVKNYCVTPPIVPREGVDCA